MALLLALWAAACMLGAGPVRAADTLVAVPPDDLRTTVAVRPAPHASQTRAYVGVVVFTVRNRTRRTVKLALRYVPDDGSVPVALDAQGSEDADVVEPAGADWPPRLAAGAADRVALRFWLPADRDASELDGALIVQAGTDPLFVHVNGTFAGPQGVTVEPASVTMSVAKIAPIVDGRLFGDEAKMTLRGAHAPELVGHGGRALTGTGLLRGDGGRAISVHWITDGASPKIAIEGNPAAGSYSGTLPLFAYTDSPSVKLTVKVHHVWLWAFLAIFAGAVVGGYLPMLTRLQRKKQLIAEGTKHGIREYRAARRELDDDEKTWLDEDLGELDADPWRRPLPWYPDFRSHGMRGFFGLVHWARDDDDLAVAAAWASKIDGQITRWMTVWRGAAPLQALIDDSKALRSIERRGWEATGVQKDSERLLDEALAEDPKLLAAAAARVRKLEQQVRRHASVAAAWHTVATDDLGDKRPELVERLFRLAGPSGDDGPHDARSWRRFWRSEYALRVALAEAKPQSELPKDRTDTKSGPADAVVTNLMAVSAPEHGVARLFPGVGSTPSAARAWGRRDETPRERESSFVERLAIQDWAMTALATALAVIAYSVVVYDDTFGSLQSYTAAFAAGFATQALAQWAAMPIFESLRLRGAPADDSAAVTDP